MAMLRKILFCGADGINHSEAESRILVNGNVHALLFLVGKERIDKFEAVEDLQLLNFFAYADIFHRNLELVGDTDDHTAFGGSIQFGDCQCVDFCGGGKLTGLLNGVLTGGSIQYQQHFVGCVRHKFADNILVFMVHLKPLKLDDSVDVDFLARQTPGFSGADIANVCNEAALIAARFNRESVGKQDFLDAVDRIIGGLEKKTKVMTEAEKRSIAIHEAGHATISWFTEFANPLVKVSIVPRGRALGAAWYLPEERVLQTKEAMLDEMCSLLGGRAAEELFIGHISTGAMNDLERTTKQAYGMVAYAGMSDKLPNLCYYNQQEYTFQKPYSETTAKLMDEEVLKMVNEQYERAKQILSEHKEGHAKLAQLLVDREVIIADDVEAIFGKRPWTSRAEELIEAQQRAEAEAMAERRAKELEAQASSSSDEEKNDEEKKDE